MRKYLGWGARLTACLVFVWCASGTAWATYATDFEAPTFSASADGVVLSGQDGWYLPAGVDMLAYTYTDNVLGIPQNPQGGDQFVAGTGPGSPDFARGQRDEMLGEGVWTFTYDMAAHYPGPAPGGNNIGSFSLQPSTTSASFIHLFSWVDLADPTSFNAYYLGYDAGGTQFAQPGASPGPEWAGLSLDHWYRFSTTVDFDANMITEVSFEDLTSGDTASFSPLDWYLGGGATPAEAPTAYRFFNGGTVPDNTIGWDNFSVIPEPATVVGLLLVGLLLRRR